MKFLKTILSIIGIVALIVAAFLLFQQFIALNTLAAAANSQNSANPPRYPNPFPSIAMVVGLAAAAGLVLGVALGLPSRTAHAIREETLDSAAAARQAQIRTRANETGTQQ